MAKTGKPPSDDAASSEPIINDPQNQIDMNDPHLSGQQAVAAALSVPVPEKEPAE